MQDSELSPRLPARALQALLVLTVAVVLLRLLYLAVLSPYELVGDEAHYWEWARRPALSYYSKGPGIAWTILAGTKLLGDTELGVRCFAALASGVTTFCVGYLTLAMTAGRTRAALFAAAIFNLIPAYQASSVLMTIDGPFLACWALALCLSWTLLDRWQRRGSPSVAPFALLGAVLAIGCLYKYTMLLLVPALAVEMLRRRHELKWNAPALVALLAALLVFVAGISPILIWNQQEGWPTARHLLGHLNVEGGDTRPQPYHYNPLWTLGYFGTQLGIIGPLAWMLIFLGWRAWKPAQLDPRALGFALTAAAPLLLMYLIVSFKTDIEGNWPIAAYLSLLPLAGLAASLPSLPWAQDDKAKANKPGRDAWRGAVVYGVVALAVTHFMPWFKPLPVLGRVLPVHRLTGHRASAQQLQAIIDERTRQTGTLPLLMSDSYQVAGLMAFYLPGHPVVRSAASRMGQRKSQYDYFADTRLSDPAMNGRRVLLVGGTEPAWKQAFTLDSLRQVGEVGQPPRKFPVYEAVMQSTEPAK